MPTRSQQVLLILIRILITRHMPLLDLTHNHLHVHDRIDRPSLPLQRSVHHSLPQLCSRHVLVGRVVIISRTVEVEAVAVTLQVVHLAASGPSHPAAAWEVWEAWAGREAEKTSTCSEGWT